MNLGYLMAFVFLLGVAIILGAIGEQLACGAELIDCQNHDTQSDLKPRPQKGTVSRNAD